MRFQSYVAERQNILNRFIVSISHYALNFITAVTVYSHTSWIFELDIVRGLVVLLQFCVALL